MFIPRRLRYFCCLNLLCVGAAIAAGCAKEPPPPSKMQVQEGIKQNNEMRERERSNQ